MAERAPRPLVNLALQGGGSPDIVNEAGWKRAQTYEKLGRPDEALTAYMDVIYGRVLRGGPGTVRAEYYWLGKAASDAGRILEARGDWSGALAVYRMAEKVGGPEAATWRDRRNWYWARVESTDVPAPLAFAGSGAAAFAEEVVIGRVNAFTLGYARELPRAAPWLSTSIGAQATLYQTPKLLRVDYGSSPLGAQFFVRVRLAGSHTR